MTTPKENAAFEISRFVYEGKTLGEIEPVTDIKDHEAQLEEIIKRLKAMDDYCWENKLVFTPTHMQNVLGLTKDQFENLKRGTNTTHGSVLCEEMARFLTARKDIIVRWTDLGRQMCLDRCASSPNPTGSIYLSKSIFHNWDTPQAEQEKKVSIELLLGRAKAVAKEKAKEKADKK